MTGEELQHGVSLPRLTFRLPPDPSRLLRARERLRDYLQQYCADQCAIDDIILAVQEACTNAIRHSGSREDIEVCLRLDGADLVAVVRDAGHGFDVASFDRETPPDPLVPGGRGLYLMAHVMDDLRLRRDGGLDVYMLKRSVVSHAAAVPSVESGLGRSEPVPERASRQERLHVLLEEIDEGFVAIDWEYRLVHVNRVAEGLVGEPRQRLLNRDVWEALPLFGDGVRQACREAMELGKPSVVEQYCSRNLRWFEVRVYPSLAGISLYLRDIDQRKRSEEGQRLTEERLRERTGDLLERVRLDEVLLAVDRLIHSTLEIEEIMHRALDQALAALRAESGTVEMREGSAWVMRYQRGGGPGEHGARRDDAEMPIAAQAAHAKAAVAFRDLLDEPATAAFARDHDVRSCLAAPLIVRELTVGCLTIWWRQPRRFSSAETEFALRLASSVSLALENSRLYEKEALEAGLAEPPPGPLWRVISGSRVHPFWVLLASVGLQAAFLSAIGQASEVRSVYGLPGSLVALIVVITGALAGSKMGALAAVAGGGVFYAFVADFGEVSSPTATLISTGVWVAAALVSGYLAEALRAQAERRRAAAVALGRAAAVREAELAEQRRVESLAAELRAEREQLLTMIEQTDTAIVILDRDFVFQVVNSSYAANMGHERDDLVGRQYFSLFPGAENEEVFRRAGETGEPVEFRARPFELPNRPDRAITYWDWRLAPVKDEAGQVRTFVLSAVDVTERVRSAQFNEALNAINARVSSRLDARHICRAVLEVAGQALAADAGMVLVKSRSVWRPVELWNLPAELESETFKPEELPFGELALREQQPAFTTAYREDPRGDPETARRLGIEALIAIPLAMGEDVRGCLYWIFRTRRAFASSDVDFARKVGAVTSQALLNARLLDDVRRVATTLQENLIHPLGSFYGLELGRVSQTAYQPELVGGDFSHVFRVDDRRVGVLIGDVEGKGIRAAGLTETVRSAVAAFALVDPAPGYVLGKANQLLLESGRADQFVTACFMLIDVSTGETSYAIAGHPAPVLLRSSSCTALEGAHGLPLGAFAGDYDVSRVRLAYGDCLILFTDGVTEARHEGELFGERRVLATVRSLSGLGAQVVAERLRQAASEFASELRDDLQILTVRYLRQ